MFKGNTVGVVIPAAGHGVRIGGAVRKQFLEIAGRPIWLHTLGILHAFSEVDTIVVAGPAEDVDGMKRDSEALPHAKLAAIVPGGTLRQDSVRAALAELRKYSPQLILVHDGVRPLFSHKLVCDVLDAAGSHSAAVPAVRPKETIKVADGDSFVQNTPDRNALYIVQTPQGFQSAVLYEAFEKAYATGFYGTDDSSLVERLGVRIKLVEGEYSNMKITTPEDLRLVEMLMKRGK